MRLTLLLPMLALAACAERRGHLLTEPGTGTPTGEVYTISGAVIDSISGAGIPGIRVSAGGYGTEADGSGQWSLTVPVGDVWVSASPVGYERTSTSLAVHSNVYVVLQARRLAPIVQECVRDGDYVHALISDLQGRKAIERWEKSEAYVLDPAGTYRVGATQWGYRALDYITWDVSIGPIAPGVTVIHWNVYDDQGYLYSGNCEPTTTPAGD